MAIVNEILHRVMVLQDQMDQLLPMMESFKNSVLKTENKIMVSLQDVQTKAAAELAQITAETDVVNAVKAVVDNQNVKLADLKQQVADLIASGATPEQLQALSDTIDAIQTADTSNAKVVSDAVVAGTPSA